MKIQSPCDIIINSKHSRRHHEPQIDWQPPQLQKIRLIRRWMGLRQPASNEQTRIRVISTIRLLLFSHLSLSRPLEWHLTVATANV